MIKLLIADDEPLVQIGLQSMLNWNELGIEICGTAANGDTAYEMIKQYNPEIVITDIQMPCSSGLELGKRCHDEMGSLPVFIILTSYEDFQYAREAIHFQALDYLVKIDLTPETLTLSINKAIEQVNIYRQQSSPYIDSLNDLQLFQERFYIRLLNHLFESDQQLFALAEEFHIPLNSRGYAAGIMKFYSSETLTKDPDCLLKIYTQALQMFQELLSKYLSCKIVALDTSYLAAVFFIDENQFANWHEHLKTALLQATKMLHNYYSVTILSSIGRIVSQPLELSSSYYDAKQIINYLNAEHPVLLWDELPDANSLKNVFNLALFRHDITKAFEELDVTALRGIFSSINELLSTDTVHFSQALDAASSILHLSMTLLTNGIQIVSDLFDHETDTYRSLYRQTTVNGILNWLKVLEQGLYSTFTAYANTQKNHLVEKTKQYIHEHIHERINLQQLSDVFGVTPNYLSLIFKKYTCSGINEYITLQKINKAKQLLNDTTLKIYEISSQLGFDSSFYFSKVFKKITGWSPKDYRNHC